MRQIPSWLAALAKLDDEPLARMLRNAPAPIRRRLFEEWSWQAHRGQIEPEQPWRVWLMMAGRGFGKTRAGAEWVSARARELGGARIALVAATIDDGIKVMIHGESGLIGVARTGEAPRWRPSKAVLEFPSGALGFVYSAERPDKLRGPQHHFAWCDELAKWPGPNGTSRGKGDECWDNLMLGLRLGTDPRSVVTTTPRGGPLIKRIMAGEGVVTSGGRTIDNVHLPQEFRAAVLSAYGGTRLGRQELDGELLQEVEGSLFPPHLLDRDRQPAASPCSRIVIGVDPPTSVEGTCGIVVCGLAAEALIVLDDRSVTGARPEGWAKAVAASAEAWSADRVVAEANQGGEMVQTVLRHADATLPVKLVHASRGKVARAEPVALLFETGRARLAGRFPELEAELEGLQIGGGYAGPGRSPDRADAMVWALGELMRGQRTPRVRML